VVAVIATSLQQIVSVAGLYWGCFGDELCRW
jgi:hypothetical protein